MTESVNRKVLEFLALKCLDLEASVTDPGFCLKLALVNIPVTRAQLLARWPRIVAQIEVSLSSAGCLYDTLFLNSHYCTGWPPKTAQFYLVPPNFIKY